MSFLSNLKLSKEDELIEMEMENSEPIEEVSVAESVQDDVDISSDAEEFQETMVAAEEDVVEMEKQEEVLEGLQEQDSIIEEKLEQPEEVTPEDVVVAQEAFAFALGRLCSSNFFRLFKFFFDDALLLFECFKNFFLFFISTTFFFSSDHSLLELFSVRNINIILN